MTEESYQPVWSNLCGDTQSIKEDLLVVHGRKQAEVECLSELQCWVLHDRLKEQQLGANWLR